MTPLFVLLLGLSSSAGLGEVTPGVVAQILVQGAHGALCTTFDSTDKYAPPYTGGWKISQSGEGRLGPGVILGAEYLHRDGGYYAKRFAWVHAGYEWRGATQTVRLLGRATIWNDVVWGRRPGDTGSLPDLMGRAVQVEYRRQMGRWLVATTQGIVVYQQVGWHTAYYMTALAGRAL